jgi:chromate reductase
MNICIISGSARTNNNTIRVAKAIKRQHQHQAVIVDFQQYDIPLMVHGDINEAALTPFQQQLCNAMIAADLIYVISPEYNWSTTPEILNWLHRFGNRQFMPLFANKVFAMVGVSTGKGGKAPALHLTSVINKIVGFMDVESIVSPKIFESHFTKEVLDEEGSYLSDNAAFKQGLESFINYTTTITERWKK